MDVSIHEILLRKNKYTIAQSDEMLRNTSIIENAYIIRYILSNITLKLYLATCFEICTQCSDYNTKKKVAFIYGSRVISLN